MVRITGYSQRKNAEGKSFIVLELEGELQVLQSQNGGVYACRNRCTLPCNFDEMTAKEHIGFTLPGSIVKIPCEPYQFTNPKTQETLTLDYRWIYKSEEQKPQGVQSLSARERIAEVI